MKTGYTHITILLDRSGSMTSAAPDVRGGIATFIDEQKKVPGDCTISINQFDGEFQTDYNFANIQDVESNIKFEPRGYTALYDGIGRAINQTGARLDELNESEKPEKVIFVIFTDGAENASREFSYNDIKELVTKQTETYSWSFTFLGANIDAMATGSSLGFSLGSTIDYDVSKTKDVYSMLSSKTALYRSSSDASMDFNDDDRKTSVA